MTYSYIVLFFLLLMLLLRRKRNRNYAAVKMLRKKGRNKEMKELAQNFVGKECLLYTLNDSQTIKGVIKEVKDNAVLIENGSSLEAVNLDFVIRIREYPRNKNGKKKSIVVD